MTTRMAAHAIEAGEGDVFLSVGVECVSRYGSGYPDAPDTYNARLVPGNTEEYPDIYIKMGETAENVAERWQVTRERQDEFALLSHQRAVAAIEGGLFDDQIVPVEVPQRKGDPVAVSRDEHPRADTSIEALARLRPAFREGGSVTAGSSSGINDGASALLVVEADRARALGLQPMARVIATAVAGVDPAIMGIGPVPASRKALERAGLQVDDLDLVELNEAFASQSVVCIDELGLDPEKVNVNGGAIALGHPLGASGGRLMTMLVHELRRRGGRYGLATMCIGVGQGIATIVERIEP
jgi:acetyl-CoA acetyltransferase family protein